ncbi:NUDIX hydrolase [Flexibacterium corallicola]|uniref:NUDIX hydrolase n=1 Tax=Flexibacterium corallicola TaxID=3037259 RepID=UPI00286F1205|nr:NAD regulator [Pseudovibrio sp. M1P-2-3]
MTHQDAMIEIGLNAVIVSVVNATPYVLTVPKESTQNVKGLPSGPFNPLQHRTFEIGLREFVEEQTALRLGHVEQLYTFGDRGRHMTYSPNKPHMVSVGYLALTRQTPESDRILFAQGARWRSWYDFFPWEDWRNGAPSQVENNLVPQVKTFYERKSQVSSRSRIPKLGANEQFSLAFGSAPENWDEERVLDRYELMYGAGLVTESKRDGRLPENDSSAPLVFGEDLIIDHRRMLATAVSRLRAKLKYRPVVFELMPSEFTLTDLQRTVEAISGHHLHKQNFRRLVESAQIVEPIGKTSTTTGGRPAAMYRFRREILKERPSLGLRVGRS